MLIVDCWSIGLYDGWFGLIGPFIAGCWLIECVIGGRQFIHELVGCLLNVCRRLVNYLIGLVLVVGCYDGTWLLILGCWLSIGGCWLIAWLVVSCWVNCRFGCWRLVARMPGCWYLC